ncbi:MAG: hypothetical protein PHH04_07035 [Thomasclavelia sp.]|jgi:hypothetical protein|nr:hypothetical protein [Thomasclavelia sp.]
MKNINMLASSLMLITNLTMSSMEDIDIDTNMSVLRNVDGENIILSSNAYITSEQAKSIKSKSDLLDINQAYAVNPNGMVTRPRIIIDESSFRKIVDGCESVYRVVYSLQCPEGIVLNESMISVGNIYN